MSFVDKINSYQNYINKELELLNRNSDNGHLMYLNEVMDYSLLSGGKRIRPMLNILFFEYFGGKREDIIKFAMAIETIHTYSLIHDDLPAMDDDTLRRMKATSHIKFDEASAILAGDALLNESYELLFEYLNDNFNKNVLKACSFLGDSAGKKGMILGQVADMELGMKNETLSNLKFINTNKTAKLIRASVVTAGIISNQNDKIIDLLIRYSDNIGLAFQLKDDLLEIESDESILGKSIGSDFRNDKKTYIEFEGIENTKIKLDNLMNNSIYILNTLGIESGLIYDLTNYLFTRKH